MLVTKIPVFTNRAPLPTGAYNQAIRAGNFLFLSGQGSETPTGALDNPTFEDRVRQVFKNLAEVASAAGFSLADAVRMNVYLESMNDFDSLDRIYREMVPEPHPARTTVACDLGGIRIEIDAVLWLSTGA